MKTIKILVAFGIIFASSSYIFADGWGNWTQYTVTSVAPQNWGSSSAKNVVIIGVSANWVANHCPCGTAINLGFIDMEASSGKFIYSQFILAQVTGKKIFIQLDQSGSQCISSYPRIIGAQLVN
jgi:hypothetical protein